MKNEICVVPFVSTYFGDCAWKLNLARAAFICVNKHAFFLNIWVKYWPSIQTSKQRKMTEYCTFLSSFLGGKSMSDDFMQSVEESEDQKWDIRP